MKKGKIFLRGEKMITKKENEDYILYFADHKLISVVNKKTGKITYY